MAGPILGHRYRHRLATPSDLDANVSSDRGKEMSAHAQFMVETGIPVFFADAQSPWQCGTNTNSNGLLRFGGCRRA